MTSGDKSSESQHASSTGFPVGCAYIDGEYCDISEARISVLDWGFLRSDATYDVVHVWENKFFVLERHLDRFLKNLGRMHLELPFDRGGLASVLHECVRRSGLSNAYVEMICTRGRSASFSRDPRDAVNNFIAFAIPFGYIANEHQRQHGLNLSISDIVRIPPQSLDPRIKNYHWLDLVRGMFEAYQRGADHTVLVDLEGNITEGPGFNVFCVSQGELITPASGVLEGITRSVVLDIAEQFGVQATQRKLSPYELRNADEIFVTSTAGGIAFAAKIDGKTIGNGKMGRLTDRIYMQYWKIHNDPDWTTKVHPLAR